MTRRIALFLGILFALAAFCAEPPASKSIDLTAADGTKLKATFYPAGKAGPGLLLMHQCNRDRSMWKDLAPKLAEAGFNVMTLDFRGFGESGGKRIAEATADEAGAIFRQFPSDVDVAYISLMSQPGVNKKIVGAAGASCGVDQSIKLAKRHPEVKSLVLLSGPTDRPGREFLKTSKELPLFGSAADDDPGAVQQMQWILSVSPNAGNVFQHYPNGGHGIEMFAPHPELASLIVNWFATTLLKTPGKAPASKDQSFRKDASVLQTLDAPGGAAKIDEMLSKAREKDPKAQLFPEYAANILAYEHLQAGETKDALDLFKLNAKAYPDSPNVYDSLADAYVATGEKELAKHNAQKAIELLANDTTDPEPRKKAIRDSAEQKLK